MFKRHKSLGLLFLLFLLHTRIIAQSFDLLIVDTFQLIGNKKSKDWIILNELHCKKGDTLRFSNLELEIEKLKNDLSRMNLFAKTQIEYKISIEQKATIGFVITMEENWYIYPSIIFEIADRNYNVWANEFNYSLKRLNLGFRLYHVNLTGVRDLFKVKYHGGHTQKAELQYERPYFSKNSNWGGGLTVLYAEEKELAIETRNDKLIFYRYNNQVLAHRKEIRSYVHFRPDFHWKIRMNLDVSWKTIDSRISMNYPAYFLGGSTHQNIPKISFFGIYNNLDHPLRPKKGRFIQIGFQQAGLGKIGSHSFTNVIVDAIHVWKLGNRFTILTTFGSQIGLTRNKRPYNFYKALGYEQEFVGGYEYYVMDGLDFALTKNMLRFQIIEKNYHLLNRMFKGSGFILKSALDAVLVADSGYANEPYYSIQYENKLTNELLYSTGIGATLTVNDVLQFSAILQLNHLGETGFFFNTKSTF